MPYDVLHERPGERSRHAVETWSLALLALLLIGTLAIAAHFL
jgi:hypothetical protein